MTAPDITPDSGPDTGPTSLTAFAPVPRKCPRHDGWTPERQRGFITALAACGSVVEAARHVGMGYTTAYRLRTLPGSEEFAAAWDAALAHATNRIHDVLVDHAIHGAPVPVMYQGEQVAEHRAFNHRLMMWLLAHHKPDQFSLTQQNRAPSNADMIAQKDIWRAEWDAEQAEKAARIAAHGAEMRERLNTKLNEMRTRLITRHEAGTPFNPRRASKVEILVQTGIEEAAQINGRKNQASE